MLAHVLLPMMTALIFLEGLCVADDDVDDDMRFVTRAKYPISFLSCGHGKPPFLPMPRDGVAARISVRLCGLDMVERLIAAEFCVSSGGCGISVQSEGAGCLVGIQSDATYWLGSRS